MILLLPWLALAQMPSHVDLDRVEDWEAAGKRAMSGPADACWEVSGSTAVTVRLHQPPRVFSRARVTTLERTGTFVGVLDGGTWTQFDITLFENGQATTSDPLVRPMVGSISSSVIRNTHAPNRPKPPPDTPSQNSVSIGVSSNGDMDVSSSTDKASEVLLDLVDGSWSDQPTTSFVQWDDDKDSLELVVDAPLQEHSPNEIVRTIVRFPGGQPVPTALDTVLPKRVTVGEGLLRARLLSAQLHVRGVSVGDQFLPSLETLSGVVGAFGMTVGYDQRIVYREARECSEQGPRLPAPAGTSP